jgi:hypothetical protein
MALPAAADVVCRTFTGFSDTPRTALLRSWFSCTISHVTGFHQRCLFIYAHLHNPPRRTYSAAILRWRARPAEHDSSECKDLTLTELVHSVAVKGHNG